MAHEDFKTALDGKSEVELTMTGRNSGREISTPVWFAREDDRLYLFPIHGSESSWYKNVQKTPKIRLSVGGAQLTATASATSDTARVEQILDQFRAKYGAGDVAKFYPKHDAAVEVPIG